MSTYKKPVQAREMVFWRVDHHIQRSKTRLQSKLPVEKPQKEMQSDSWAAYYSKIFFSQVYPVSENGTFHLKALTQVSYFWTDSY